MLTNLFTWILVGLGALFNQFCLEVGRPRGPKTLKNQKHVQHFAISTNLPTRGHMIEFLINLALNLAPKTHHKSTQEPPKINTKSIKNNVQHMIRFSSIFIDFGGVLGSNMASTCVQLGAQEASKLNKNRSKNGSYLGHCFWLIFDCSWEALGWIFGGFWVPSWGPSWLKNRSYGLLLASWPK